MDRHGMLKLYSQTEPKGTVSIDELPFLQVLTSGERPVIKYAKAKRTLLMIGSRY